MKPKAGSPDATPLLAAAALLGGLALALPACSGNPAKESLAAYEAAVERVMKEDERIQARLAEMRKEMEVQNRGAEELGPFVRETAGPFYERFRKSVGEIPAPTEELQAIHARLMEYAGHRVDYLEALGDIETLAQKETLQRFNAARAAWAEARQEFAKATGGQRPDPDVLSALGTGELYMQKTLDPFLRGQVPREDAARILREEVLPPLAKVAERTRPDLSREEKAGAVARWAKAELEFYRALADALPDYADLMGAGRRSEEEWELGEETRRVYLEKLKAYRESLR